MRANLKLRCHPAATGRHGLHDHVKVFVADLDVIADQDLVASGQARQGDCLAVTRNRSHLPHPDECAARWPTTVRISHRETARFRECAERLKPVFQAREPRAPIIQLVRLHRSRLGRHLPERRAQVLDDGSAASGTRLLLPPKQIELGRPARELIEERSWERVCDCHCVSAV